METGFMFAITHNEEIALLAFDQSSSINNIQSFIRGKWPQLASNEFSLHCSVGGKKKCMLSTQDDLMNTISMCKMFSLKLIDVSISLSQTKQSVTNPCTIPSNGVSSKSGEVGLNTRKTGVNGIADAALKIYSNFNFSPMDGGGTSNRGESDEFQHLFAPPATNISPDLVETPLLSLKWRDAITGVGQLFRGGREEFRVELVKYATNHRFLFVYSKNNRQYVYANCKEKSQGCNWFIRGKHFEMTGHFEITECNLVHDCGGQVMKADNKRLGPKIWGKLLLENVKGKPKRPGVEMKIHMKLAYGVDVKYDKAWRAVEAAKGHIYGTYNKSFNRMKRYCKAVRRTNPGSVAIVEPDKVTKRFNRSFFAWNACIEGFKDCRPMISVDGTHMYGRWRGVILSATGKDGNNGLFPIAIALVAAETLENWVWFLEKLRDFVKHEKRIFYLSDRNAGLMSAFPIVFEKPINFYCLFHLHNNLRSFYAGPWTKVHRDGMCKLLTECAYAPNEVAFKNSMAKFLCAGKGLAEKFLENLEPKFWAYAYAPDIVRYGEMTSNASESFNNWIKVARGLPVTHMVENIRAEIMRWFVERKEDAAGWTSLLCTKRQDIWNFYVDGGRTWFVTDCPDGTLLVGSTPSVVVNLEKRTCTCHQWQIHGFPCAHATASIIHRGASIFDMIDPCFFSDTYRKAYSPILNPVPETALLVEESSEDEDEILPPETKNGPGRPRNKRKKSYGEVPKMRLKLCPICNKKTRHDRHTCHLLHPAKKKRTEGEATP